MRLCSSLSELRRLEQSRSYSIAMRDRLIGESQQASLLNRQCGLSGLQQQLGRPPKYVSTPKTEHQKLQAETDKWLEDIK